MPTPAGHMITIDAGTLFDWARYHSYYPDLEMNEWRQHYETAVLNAVRSIEATASGMALLGATRHPITVNPLKDPTVVNAFNATDGDGVEKGVRISVKEEGGSVLQFGRGIGATSTILFTPGIWIPTDPLYYRKWWQMTTIEAGADADIVLYHELVHAVMAGLGKVDITPMEDGYDEVAEFHAVVLANIFASETRRPLRLNHNGHAHLTPGQSAATVFYEKYAAQIAHLCAAAPELTKRIAEVDCAFNPIREHYMYSIPLVGAIMFGMSRPKPPVRVIDAGTLDLPVGPGRRRTRRRR